MKYEFSSKLKNICFALMGLGLISLVASFIVYSDNTQRVWANLLVNAFFFTGIALAGTFFLAVNIVAESGWYTTIKRIPEALGQYLPFGLAAMLIVLIAGIAGVHHVWHWMDPEVVANDPYRDWERRQIVRWRNW